MEARERILAVGRDILLSAGLRSLTTNEVARRAKVSKKTLYRLFESKESLAETILLSFIKERLSEWDAILDSDRPITLRLRESFAFVERFLPQLQSSVVAHVAEVDPILWEKIDRIRRARLGRLKDLFAEAQQAGFVIADIDADQWFLLFLNTVQHAVTPKTLLEQNIMLSDLIRTARRIYFDSLLTPDGRRALSGVPKEIR